MKTGTACVPKDTTQPTDPCSNFKAIADCPANTCKWDTAQNQCLAVATTQPVSGDYCATITAVAECVPDKGCKFDNNVCRQMSQTEREEHSWNDLMAKAAAQGLPAGATKIPKDIIGKILDNEDPWSKAETFAIIDKVDTEKDGITKEEYIGYSQYE